MKKLFLLALMLPLAFTSCSSDDEDVQFANTEISLIPQATKVNKFGQYQIHTAELSVRETGVVCQWNFSSPNDEGFSSNENVLNWWPKETGTYTITATLKKDGATKVITKKCEVVECSGGFGFAYQPANEIMANETMYSAYYYQTVPEVTYTTEKIGSETYNVWIFKDGPKGYYRKYYFGNEGLKNVLHIPL